MALPTSHARFKKFIGSVGDSFWLVPAACVAFGILLALGLGNLDKSGVVPDWMIKSEWLYSGGDVRVGPAE